MSWHPSAPSALTWGGGFFPLEVSMSYWVGLRARIGNPENPHFERVGVIVTEPDKDRCIVVRFDDGTHANVGCATVDIELEPEGIEPT